MPMKAEHISIALELEQIPNVGDKTARLLRQAGIHKPAELAAMDAYHLYDKICQITRVTQSPQLLDVLLAAVDFANGGAPRHWSGYTAVRKTLLSRAN